MVKAAKAGMTDTAVAVDGLTSVMNAFGLSADHATEVSDLMFATVKRGKLTFPELAANIGKVAPMARAAGMSMQDMMAAIATMTRQGLNTEEATTRLTNILKQAPDAAKDIASLVQKYVGKSLAEIQIDFPEIRSASGIAALAGDFAGFTKDLELMKTAAGSADEAFGKMRGGVVEQLNQMKQAALQLFVAVGEALAPELHDITEQIKEWAAGAGEWISQNKQIIIDVAKFAAQLIIAGAALKVFALPFKMMVGIISAVTTAVKGLQIAFTFLAAHPVVAVILAIVAAATIAISIIDKLASTTAELSTVMEEANEARDKQRAKDSAALDRLAQLEKKNQLNNKEMHEARGLINGLTKAYGDLGIRLDETTGRLTGVASAQAIANRKMLEAQKIDLERNEAERQANMTKIMEARNGGWNTFKAGIGFTGSIDEASKKYHKEELKLAAVQKRLQAVNALLNPTADSGPGGTTDTTDAIRERIAEDEKAIEKRKDAEEDAARNLADVRLKLVKDEHERELREIDLRYDRERDKAKALGADLSAIDEARLIEKNVLQAQYERKAAEKAADERKKAADEQRQKQLELWKANRSVAEENARLEIQTNEKLSDADKQRAELALERAIAIRDAWQAGENWQLVGRQFDLRAKLLEQQLAAQKKAPAANVTTTFGATGTFNPFAVAGLFAGSAMDRTAKATEETARGVKKLNDKAKPGVALTFAR